MRIKMCKLESVAAEICSLLPEKFFIKPHFYHTVGRSALSGSGLIAANFDCTVQVWPHLEQGVAKRARMTAAQDHLAQLYSTIMAVSGA